MKKILFALISGILVFPATLGAQYGGDVMDSPIKSKDDILILLRTLLGYAWNFAAIIVVLMFLYAGFLFVTAAGSEDKVNSAKAMVKYGLIGVAVMILSGGVMALIQSFLTPGA